MCTIILQVPVVATVIQTFDEMGKMRIDVEPPGPELENQNNELQKNSKKNVIYKLEPEIFCESLEDENENTQEFAPPNESGKVQLLSINEAKKIFNCNSNQEEICDYVNTSGSDFGTFGTIMTFVKNTENMEEQNHISSTSNMVSEEMYLVPGKDPKILEESDKISEILL